MTKKLTFKNKVLGFFLILLGLLGSSAFNKSHAQAPYCSATTNYGPCSNYNMYVGTVRVQQGSTVLFNKANDACNTSATSGGGYTLISSTPSFSLSGGSNYSMTFNTGPTYTVKIGVWIDMNQDYDFADAGEFISTGWADLTPGVTNMQTRNFTLGCSGIKSGTTRMRIRSEYQYGTALSAGASCVTINYGETEDYTITLALPTSISAGFYMPSTAYVGTPVKMTNNNQTGYTGHQWDIDDNGTNEYTSVNANHVFNTAGTQCVRLRSQNCLGRDSVLKCINIIAPVVKPIADFAANTNEVERFGTVNFLDLSTQGPTYWSWFMYDPVDSINTRLDVESFNSNLVGSNPFVNANPSVFFNKTGNYTVCLQTSNAVGPSSLRCKKNYVRVTPFKDNNMGAGTVQPIYEAVGNIIDDGGRTGNYSNNRIDYATIIPCGASKITLKFSQFKVKAGDLLKIYDGPNAAGKALHPGTGFTLGSVPTGPIVANSGAMYLYFSTTITDVDSGFIASWTTEKGVTPAPIASFTIPDTLYNPNTYTFVNTS
ncbi:MAG: GEVED domain-containing protein, partial [Bacteroidia bacterium]